MTNEKSICEYVEYVKFKPGLALQKSRHCLGNVLPRGLTLKHPSHITNILTMWSGQIAFTINKQTMALQKTSVILFSYC